MSKNVVNNLLNISLFCQVTLSRGTYLNKENFKAPLGGFGGLMGNEHLHRLIHHEYLLKSV